MLLALLLTPLRLLGVCLALMGIWLLLFLRLGLGAMCDMPITRLSHNTLLIIIHHQLKRALLCKPCVPPLLRSSLPSNRGLSCFYTCIPLLRQKHVYSMRNMLT